ncbi:MAG: 23S rRNA (adenine(2503)-C(2))-methyltransferase RlmN [Phycisphaerales bacterium]|nr:MAG: 23S rRNA (adenine(2503)-C(2))-methyltransferase RlmN [Phycisphaerales bacterium]
MAFWEARTTKKNNSAPTATHRAQELAASSGGVLRAACEQADLRGVRNVNAYAGKEAASFGEPSVMNTDLTDKTLEELEQTVLAFQQKKYLARYIFSFIHAKGVRQISQLSPLSKAFRRQLTEQGYYICQLNSVTTLEDPDGTVKYLFQLADGNRIEAVLLNESGRRTACVSTQVGCAMNCSFCATARVRLRRNLTAGEIVDQVNTIEQDRCRISNVVYMGMGEPLLNYDAVLKSVRILNHPDGKQIGVRHITVSTCGIAPAIRQLATEDIRPRLAISLNAPTDALRTRLMPVNAKYPLAALLQAVHSYQIRTRQRVTFEYVMIDGINDKSQHARALVERLRPVHCNVNLIEHNPHPGCKFVSSSVQRIGQFAEILTSAGVETTVRLRMGRKINAACGQLGADWRDG